MTLTRETLISKCQNYRYLLWREWGGRDEKKPYVLFIGLNPSTADETIDDPTIRRCINFVKLWGYESLCMANLFAYRATDPKELDSADEPIGELNNKYLRDAIKEAEIIVLAWGNKGSFIDRDKDVIQLLTRKANCLGMTNKNQPKHPLYIKADQELIEFKNAKK